MMSITPQVTGSNGKVIEDCRDYLRTGRCKYGASCKYNHPPNVQNGGGLKPLDPTEPMFPSRPNEPICQYYLKHGTCKFGQACKFDHPPQNTMHVVAVGGQVQFMNMGQISSEPQPAQSLPVVINSAGPDTNGMVLQFLPQRIDEPDCIYFLKNGRCKYGATCRYHHPIPSHGSRRGVDTKQRRQADLYPSRGGQNVQYFAQMYPSYTTNRGMNSYESSPVAFANMENKNGSSHSYQIVTSNDGVTSYCIPVPSGSAVPTEPGSSASSLASSYEASQDYLNEQWNRARRNNSANSLNGVNISDAKPQRILLSQSVSEGNIVPRQFRSTSYGSASEMNPSTLPRNTSTVPWNPRAQAGQFVPRQELHAASPNANLPQRRVIRGRNPRGNEGGHDEGFSMMTSALLNMLDTPEEAVGENVSDDEYRYSEENDDIKQLDYNLFRQMSINDQQEANVPLRHDRALHYVDRTSIDKVARNSQYLPSNNLSPSEETLTAETGQSWSPSWLGGVDGPDDSGYIFSMLPPNAPSSSADSDGALYFP